MFCDATGVLIDGALGENSAAINASEAVSAASTAVGCNLGFFYCVSTIVAAKPRLLFVGGGGEGVRRWGTTVNIYEIWKVMTLCS